MSYESPQTNERSSGLTNWLQTVPTPVFMFVAIAAAFSTYFCMYAFRKPFSAAQYSGLQFFGTTIDLKTAFVISQTVGYALSKVIGMKVCSEVRYRWRSFALVSMIVAAQLALFCFATLPNHWKVVAIFFNGLPLGMVWGLVVRYLEGRRTSEMLLAGLSCSFILASGAVKDVGRWLMSAYDVPEFWMPFFTGLIFMPPFFVSVWALNQIPNPDDEDIRARVKRQTMNGQERRQFVVQFLPGLLMLFTAYFFLTAYRDYRDNFGVEIFQKLGYGEDEVALFTRCEIWVAFGVLGALAMLNLVKSNRLGFVGAIGIMTFGVALMGVGTILLDLGRINGFVWMVLCGLGSYLAYVPYGSVLFDRLIASTRAVGTAVFAIYVADSVGYGGAITVLLTKDLAASDVSRLDFFRHLTYFMSILGALLMVTSCVYFVVFHLKRQHGTSAPQGN